MLKMSEVNKYLTPIQKKNSINRVLIGLKKFKNFIRFFGDYNNCVNYLFGIQSIYLNGKRSE